MSVPALPDPMPPGRGPADYPRPCGGQLCFGRPTSREPACGPRPHGALCNMRPNCYSMDTVQQASIKGLIKEQPIYVYDRKLTTIGFACVHMYIYICICISFSLYTCVYILYIYIDILILWGDQTTQAPSMKDVPGKFPLETRWKWAERLLQGHLLQQNLKPRNLL